MKFPGLCRFVVEEGGVIEESLGSMSTDLMFSNIISGLETANGASIQNRSRLAGTTAALSDQFIGLIGAIISDYKPDRGSRMVLEY